MLRNFYVLAIRNFYKNRAYSIINILGLSVGLSAFIMLTLFVKYESSYDTFNKDYERIFRVEQKVRTANEISTWSQMPAATSTVLEEKYPEVEEAISFQETWGEYLSSTKERTFYEENGYYANPDIFDLFNIKFVSGKKKTALDAPMKIALSESLAKKLFPDSDPVGQDVLADSKRTYIVSAVFKDLPYNSNTRFSYLIPYSTKKQVGHDDVFDHWDWWGTRVYIKLKKGVDYKLFESKIKYLLDDYLKDRDDELLLKPMRMIHLYPSSEDKYWVAVMLYGTVGLFTLLIAALNFVNLTTAYSLTRAKEIGLKKVLGSSKMKLIKEFLGESLIIVFISLLIAFTITEAVLPVFNRIVSVPLEIKYFDDWHFTLFIVGITAITGVLSGLYPAFVLSSAHPVSSLKNQIFQGNRFKKLFMRKGLVVFQLALSIIFVSVTLTVLNQFRYLKNKDLGFNKNNLLITSIKETKKVKVNDFRQLRNELLQIPDVIETSLSYTAPFYSSWGRSVDWEGSQPGENMMCRFNCAYATFLKTMKIDLVAGKDFDLDRNFDSTVCLVNQTFINTIGWTNDEAIGKKVWNNDYTIIGVMKDFNERTPFIKIQPYILIQHSGYLTGVKTILFRMKDGYSSTSIHKINKILKAYFTESNFTVSSFDQNANYSTNKVYLGMAKTFGFFSVIAIIMAIIGLLSIVSFNSKRKVKEIGVRKVLGARATQIFVLIAKEYMRLIIIANIIAIPLGLFIEKIDPSYYKAQVNYRHYIWMILISVFITLLTISIQVIKSVNTNPVESLRYE